MNTIYTPRNLMTGAVSRGGIDTSDMDKYPDAVYWKRYALGAYNAAVELVGVDRAEILIGQWRDEDTWMAICLHTEKALADLREMLEAGGAMLEGLQAAVIITAVAVEEYGHEPDDFLREPTDAELLAIEWELADDREWLSYDDPHTPYERAMDDDYTDWRDTYNF